MAATFLFGKNLRKLYSNSFLYARVLGNSSKNCIPSRSIQITRSRTNVIQERREQGQFPRLKPIALQKWDNAVDNSLQKLDLAVRRTGRITRRELNDVFNQLKNSENITSSQSLLILRCCGSLLVEELPESRNELASEVWDTLKKSGIQLDVSHYNTLLQVYLENEHEFNPMEFLAEMENNAIHPNRVTYVRLIEHYCQSGDIEGAGKILERMKQQDLAINEKVFNALITGHARANDMESAEGVFDLMKNAKLDPSPFTYTSLLCAYAERGDINAIRETIQKIQKSQIMLWNENYLEVIYTLAKNGHTEHADEILLKLQRNSFGFISESIITMYKLINCNQVETAFKLLKMIPVLDSNTGEPRPVGNFFIRHMVKTEKPPEKIAEICNELKSLNLHSKPLCKAAEVSLYLGKEAHALKFLQLLKEEEKDFPFRPHYFWPILVAYNKKNGTSKIWDILELMMKMEAPANYRTFTDYVYPFINTEDTEFILNKLKSFGYSTGDVISPLVDHFVQEDNLTDANNLIEKYVIRLRPAKIVTSLAGAYNETEDISSTLKILKKVQESAAKESSYVSKVDWIGGFLIDCIKITSKSEVKIAPLLESLYNEDINISERSLTQIKKIWPNAPENIINILEKLATSSLDVLEEETELEKPIHPREMTIEQLESHLIELKSKNMNTRGVLRRLLLLHGQKKNLQRVEEIKNKLDAQNFVYSHAMMAQLMDLYVYHNDEEKATKCFNALQNAENFVLDTFKLINYAALLVKENKIDEAFKILMENLNKEFKIDAGRTLEGSVWRLLNAAAEKDVDTCQKFFDIVKENICKPTNIILGPLIKSYLLKDDVKGALAKFEECCELYSCTPWRNELFLRFIEMEDVAALQKVIDQNSKIHGEANTLHDLAKSFLLSRRYKEARRVLQTPGLRAKQQRLNAICEELLETDKVEELEQFIKITENLFDVDRDHMYLYLIRSYYKTKDYKKALDVWVTMQDENVHPSDDTLIYLAKFLQECNQPVPFAVPEVKVKSASHSIEKKYVSKGQLDEALNERRKLVDEGKSTTIKESSFLIRRLIDEQRLNEALKLTVELLNQNQHPYPDVFRHLLNQFAEKGDIDTIKSLESKLSERLKGVVRYNNTLFRAYIRSNRHLEYIEHLENNVASTVNECPSGAFLQLLHDHPDLSERVHKLALEYTKHDYYDLLNIMWLHYMIAEDVTKANEILKDTPMLQTRLNFGNGLRHAKEFQKEELCLKFLEIAKSMQLPPRHIGQIYNSLIEIECVKQNFIRAAEYLAKAKQENMDSFLHKKTLEKLSASLSRDNTKSQKEKKVSAERIEADDSESDDDKVMRKS